MGPPKVLGETTPSNIFTTARIVSLLISHVLDIDPMTASHGFLLSIIVFPAGDTPIRYVDSSSPQIFFALDNLGLIEDASFPHPSRQSLQFPCLCCQLLLVLSLPI